jgi:hypothetical protein
MIDARKSKQELVLRNVNFIKDTYIKMKFLAIAPVGASLTSDQLYSYYHQRRRGPG